MPAADIEQGPVSGPPNYTTSRCSQQQQNQATNIFGGRPTWLFPTRVPYEPQPKEGESQETFNRRRLIAFGVIGLILIMSILAFIIGSATSLYVFCQ